MAGTSPHTFCWLVNENRLFSSFSLFLWVVSCEVSCWFDLMLFISICGLFSYAMVDMDYFGCKHVFWTTSFLHAKFKIIVKLTIRCIWSQGYWAWVILNYFTFLWVPIWKVSYSLILHWTISWTWWISHSCD